MVKHPILSMILLSLAVASEAQVSTKAEPLYVSMLQLISTPEKFDGKLVSVIGYLRFELHGNLLFVHREDEENGILSNSDRKSTRLNSSHQIISYAVFCLKKKRIKR